MRKGIGQISREMGVKSFQLHKWEERGWLGSEPILKDPNNNNQRVYSEEQVKRIEFIQETIQKQRKKGIKRTDFHEMEQLLLEKFGGEVTVRQEEMVEMLPASLESFQQLITNQSKEIVRLRDVVTKLEQRELPQPVDHTEEMQRIMGELEEAKAREEKREKTINDMNEKLQKAVELIASMEKQQNEKPKTGFFRRLFE